MSTFWKAFSITVMVAIGLEVNPELTLKVLPLVAILYLWDVFYSRRKAR